MKGKAHNKKVNNICVLLILIIILEMCLLMGFMLYVPRQIDEVLYLLDTLADCTSSAIMILCTYGINNGMKLAWYVTMFLCIFSIIDNLSLSMFFIIYLVPVFVMLSVFFLLLNKDVRAHCSIGKHVR